METHMRSYARLLDTPCGDFRHNIKIDNLRNITCFRKSDVTVGFLKLCGMKDDNLRSLAFNIVCTPTVIYYVQSITYPLEHGQKILRNNLIGSAPVNIRIPNLSGNPQGLMPG